MTDGSGVYDYLAIPETHADFTTQLGHLIYLGYDSDEKLHLDATHYPIFDESYRSTLNKKIVEHYVFREIGLETPQMFVFNLGRKMNEIMTYYNQLYVSAQQKYDPMLTQDLYNDSDTTNTTESSGKTSASQTSDNKTSSSNDTTTHSSATTVHSEFPQTRLQDFLQFATNADQTNSDSTSSTNGTQESSTTSSGNNQTDFTHQTDKGTGSTHSHGYAGLSGAQLINAWRSTMLNIDMMIVSELSGLFMGIVGMPEEMTHKGRIGVYNDYRF
mgnify:CR=1 FL=1